VFFNFIHFRKCPQCERSEPLFPNNLFLNKAGQAQNSEVGTKVGRSGVDELWIAAGVPRRMMCWARWYMLGGGCVGRGGICWADDVLGEVVYAGRRMSSGACLCRRSGHNKGPIGEKRPKTGQKSFNEVPARPHFTGLCTLRIFKCWQACNLKCGWVKYRPRY
jgi:hypothetical protein